MYKIIGKELLLCIPILLLVSFFSFIILQYIPGDLQTIQYGLDAISNEESSSIPLLHVMHEYKRWITEVILHNNWGYSPISEQPVLSIIIPKWKKSIVLACISMLITILCAIVWCWVQEYFYNRKNRKIFLFLFKGMNFLEIILLSFIPVSLSLLILSIVSSMRISLIEMNNISQFILPTLVMVLLQTPMYTRSLRASIRQVSRKRFIDFAYILGFSRTWIWWKEIIPNACLFTFTLSIVQMSYLIGGSIVIERIFLFPGLGNTLIDAVLQRDNTLVHSIVVVVSGAILLLHVIFITIQHYIYGETVHE